jgi:hypothetical protein
MKTILLALLLLSSASLSWGEEDVFTERTATIEVEGAFWDVGAPKTLYCRFPIRQWTRDKVATKQEIPANEFDGTAIVKVGKEKTVLKQGKFTHELETLSASSQGVHAVEVNWITVRTFQYNAKEGHALWSDSGSTTITTFIGNCAAFEE